MNAKLPIVWDIIARDYLKESLQYVRKDSPQNADKIKSEIRTAINRIPDQPYRYPADKYRNNNDGSFRAFEMYSLRISYFVGSNEIRIVRIRNTNKISYPIKFMMCPFRKLPSHKRKTIFH